MSIRTQQLKADVVEGARWLWHKSKGYRKAVAAVWSAFVSALLAQALQGGLHVPTEAELTAAVGVALATALAVLKAKANRTAETS